MDLDQIDWHKTGLLVAVIATGIVGLWLLWRILRLLLRVVVFLAMVVVVAALVTWWVRHH